MALGGLKVKSRSYASEVLREVISELSWIGRKSPLAIFLATSIPHRKGGGIKSCIKAVKLKRLFGQKIWQEQSVLLKITNIWKRVYKNWALVKHHSFDRWKKEQPIVFWRGKNKLKETLNHSWWTSRRNVIGIVMVCTQSLDNFADKKPKKQETFWSLRKKLFALLRCLECRHFLLNWVNY